MLSRKILGVAVASIGAAAALAASAQAIAAAEGNDALSEPRPAISLVTAVGSAEQAAGGYATKAEYERTKAGWAYDVEVVNGSKVFDVRIDATSGKVVSSQEDAADTGKNDGEDKPD